MKIHYLHIAILILGLLIPEVSMGQFQRKNPTYEKSDTNYQTPTNPTSSTPTEAPKSNLNKKFNLLNKMAIGGNFSLSFGNVTFINISPAIGYKLTDKFMPGIGLTYMYYNVRGLSQHFYGGNIFARYSVFSNFFLQGELEALHVSGTYNGKDLGISRWAISPLIGGGYIIRIGQYGGIILSLLYNLNYNPNTSIYSSPIVYRVGFIF